MVTTNAGGRATFLVPAGDYSASATHKISRDGVFITHNGANTKIGVTKMATTFPLKLREVIRQQIIIKELYSTGCPDNSGKAYNFDSYIVLYNNSETEADASDIVFAFAAPYNSPLQNGNKYIVDGALIYENESWLPAYNAIWWFTEPVTIPPYSQIVIAVFGAIDHTETVSASVDLSNPDYYWMSNDRLTSYTNGKYKCADNIPASHYLTCIPYTQGNAWALSVTSPAFYIGKMPREEAAHLSNDKNNYDTTLGTSAPFYVVKFPQANVIDAVEVWVAAGVENGFFRFPAIINTGYIGITNNLGHTVYRNVDRESTEALEENQGKLVYGYSGGTYDEAKQTGTTDPSGIDAEASIANGAHIIYSDTNDTGKDFHERQISSLKRLETPQM